MSILQEARKKLNIQQLAQESNVDPEAFKKQAQLEKLALFYQIQKEYPTLKNNEICQHLHTSATTMRRVRKELGASSPYRYDIPTKKSSKKPDQIATMENLKGSKDTKDTKNTKNKKKVIAGDIEIDVKENEGDYLDGIIKKASKEEADSPYKFKMPTGKELLSNKDISD